MVSHQQDRARLVLQTDPKWAWPLSLTRRAATLLVLWMHSTAQTYRYRSRPPGRWKKTTIPSPEWPATSWRWSARAFWAMRLRCVSHSWINRWYENSYSAQVVLLSVFAFIVGLHYKNAYKGKSSDWGYNQGINVSWRLEIQLLRGKIIKLLPGDEADWIGIASFF